MCVFMSPGRLSWLHKIELVISNISSPKGGCMCVCACVCVSLRGGLGGGGAEGSLDGRILPAGNESSLRDSERRMRP